MTFAPPTLRTLGTYWTAHGGVNLGVVGDVAHQAKGTSYHLGKSQLDAGAYSAVTRRDRAGLSDAASAIDLGRIDGSLGRLQSFSSWLVTQARANKPGTGDMREIIYSPDGRQVMRWDRERGYTSLPRSGEADDSHLTHTHISWYRDAEARDHTTAFRPYFVSITPPDTSTGEAMSIYTRRAATGRFSIAVNAVVHGYRPVASGWEVAKTWEKNPASSAPFMAHLTRTAGTTAPSSLLECAAGFFAGLYVSTADVVETFDPAPVPVDCTAIQKQLDIANGRISRAITDLGGTQP